MRFDTVIRNGTVVTASDAYAADVGIAGDKITAIAQSLPVENAGKVIDAAGLLVLPGGIDVHTHLDMPFGGTTSADDFETGTIAAALRRHYHADRLRDSIQRPELRQAFETWMKKADGKAAIDYAFHCIITDLGDGQLEEMGQLSAKVSAVLSFSWPIPGVSCWTTPRFFAPCRKRRSMADCLHARGKWRRDRCDRQARPGRRQTRPEISRAHAADHGRGRGRFASDRAGGNGRRASLHRASILQRSPRKSSRGARPRVAGVCRDLPAISLSLA